MKELEYFKDTYGEKVTIRKLDGKTVTVKLGDTFELPEEDAAGVVKLAGFREVKETKTQTKAAAVTEDVTTATEAPVQEK